MDSVSSQLLISYLGAIPTLFSLPFTFSALTRCLDSACPATVGTFICMLLSEKGLSMACLFDSLLLPIPKLLQNDEVFCCLLESLQFDWRALLVRDDLRCNRFCCCFCCISIDGLRAPTGTFLKWSSAISA